MWRDCPRGTLRCCLRNVFHSKNAWGFLVWNALCTFNDGKITFWYPLVWHAFWYIFTYFPLYCSFLQKEEGIDLVCEAIRSGIFNDLGSGSNVDVCVITKVFPLFHCVAFLRFLKFVTHVLNIWPCRGTRNTLETTNCQIPVPMLVQKHIHFLRRLVSPCRLFFIFIFTNYSWHGKLKLLESLHLHIHLDSLIIISLHIDW